MNPINLPRKVGVAVTVVSLLLLALAIWLNRPAHTYVDATFNQKDPKTKLYRVCVVQHKWGTQLVCAAQGEGFPNYTQIEFAKYQVDKIIGWKTSFQWTPAQ